MSTYSVHDTCSNPDIFHVDSDLLETNFTTGRGLVTDIESGQLTGDDLRPRVCEFLEASASVVGSPNVAKARLDLYESLDTLTDYEISEQLGRYIDDAVKCGRRLIQVDQEAAAMFKSL